MRLPEFYEFNVVSSEQHARVASCWFHESPFFIQFPRVFQKQVLALWIPRCE